MGRPKACLADGPYGVFAGRDASRGLATMDLSEKALKDEYDDLDGLSDLELEEMREWFQTFRSESYKRQDMDRRVVNLSLVQCATPKWASC